MAAHFKTVLDGADDHAKLHDLCKLTYKEQAVWLLNAIWEVEIKKEGKQGGELAEKIWNYVDKASTIDNAKATGNALDELEAHRFLEAFDEAHTVLQMRSSLRKTGALGESERPKEVPLTHFFLDKYEVDWHKLVNAPQGDNSAKIAEAQDKLQAVQDAFDAASAALKEAQAREADAKARESEAIAAENASKKAEAEAHASAEEAAKKEASAKQSAAELAVREEEVKKSQAELAAALEEVKKQEEAYKKKTEELTKKSEEGGVVSRNKAKNELAQHLAEDPLPLRQAKITAEAALRKAEKATKAAEEARVTAEADAAKASEANKAAQADAQAASAARAEAEASRAQAEAARAQAESARADAEDKLALAHQAVAEAEALLAELMANPGSGHGALWWIERELTEKKKYMPVSKGGIR